MATTEELEYALIMHQSAQPQPVLEKFLHLLLSYEYGIELLAAKSPGQSHFRLRGYGPRLSSIFVVLDDTLDAELQRQIEEHAAHALIFLLMPTAQVHKNESLRKSSENIYICTWEDAFRPKAESLNQVVLAAFEKNAIESLLSDDLLVFDGEKQERIERRLNKIKTLPTLPDIVVRIMELIDDPESKVEDLEEILVVDPAIVTKIFQVINTPALSGVERKEELTLNEAIVRLGLKKVGAIAQQIELMNSLVKPDESDFNMRRYWEHSVGCALLANELYNGRLISLPVRIEFNDYWLGALLHDIGKLVLGFFFQQRFADILRQQEVGKTSFRKAETQLGDVSSHEQIAQLFLLKAQVGREMIDAAASHHTTGNNPDGLVCLVHMADNLCKDLGMGYLAGERGRYSAAVLQALKLEKADLKELKEKLQPLVEQTRQMVDQCM